MSLFSILNNKENRIKLASVLILLAYIIIFVKIFFIYFTTIGEDDDKVKDYNINTSKSPKFNILDANGSLLATNIESYNFYIMPSKTVFAQETANKVLKLFPELEIADFITKLKGKKNRLILVKKEITKEQKDEILNAGIEGAEFEGVYARVYPYGNIFSHIVGFVNSNLEGVYGLERSFNNELYHNDINTSLDARVQTVLHAKLFNTFKEYNAESAFGIIANAQTGEVLSLVSLPDFNPKKLPESSSKEMVNTAVSSVYNLGSVFKILTIAMGVENGVKESQTFKVDQKIQVDKTFTLQDERIVKPLLTPAEILAFSSNVGSVLLLESAGVSKQRVFFEKLGVFTPPKLELSPYEIATPLYKVGSWSKSMHYTATYGYGVLLSPIHFIEVANTIILDGKKRNLTLLKNNHKSDELEQVISTSTAKKMQNIIRAVVSSGTAKRANINGYEICGKTSTSLTFDSKKKKWTNTKKLVSFFSFFPCSDPKYIVYIGINAPKETEKDRVLQGGRTVAPLAADIISEIAPLLNVKPDFRERTN